MRNYIAIGVFAIATLATAGSAFALQDTDQYVVERRGHRVVETSPDGSGADSEVKHRRVVRVFSTGESGTGDERVVWVDKEGPGSYGYSFGLGPRRGFLGVQLVGLSPELRSHFGAPEDAGLLISVVADDSPAAKAGLRVGDVLAAIDGEAVTHSFDVVRRISGLEEGDSVALEIWRDRRLETLTAVIEERKRPALDVGQFVFSPGSGQLSSGVEIDLGALPDQVIEIDEDGIQKALEDLQLKFDDPKMFERFQILGQDRIDLQKRIEELEGRLKELESMIEKLPEE